MLLDIQAAIGRCREEVLADAQHRLSFSTRRELLRCLGPMHLAEDGYGRELRDGKRRRLELAWQCAMRVSEAWQQAYRTAAVRDLLQLVRIYLDGRCEIRVVEKATDSLQGALSNNPLGQDAAYLAGRAACACGWVAVGDELLVPDEGVSAEELDDPQDPDLWDTAFFAACAHARGIPGTHAFDKQRLRDFWLWYLDSAVASVCKIAG